MGPPPRADPLAELNFATPTLNAAKEALPVFRAPPAAAARASAAVAESAFTHADKERFALRQKSASRASLRAQSSKASLAADLKAYELPHSPAQQHAQREEAVPRGRRPGVGGWQPWPKDDAGKQSSWRPRGVAGRPQRPASATPSAAGGRRTSRPDSAAAAAQVPNADGLLTTTAETTTTKTMRAPPPLIDKMGFSEGYKYDGQVLRPGSLFFAALEAAARDHLDHGLPPLPLRLPPTIVTGIGSLRAGEDAHYPLWLWSDTGRGGGLRTMRRPISGDSGALEFLIGRELAAEMTDLSLEREAARARAEAAAKAEAEAKAAYPYAVPSRTNTANEGAAAEAADPDESPSSASEAAAAAAAVSTAASRARAAADAARERRLSAACAVSKTGVAPAADGAASAAGLQTVRVLSALTLSSLLTDLAAQGRSGSGDAAVLSTNAADVTVVQRFIHPPVSRASVLRVVHRQPLASTADAAAAAPTAPAPAAPAARAAPSDEVLHRPIRAFAISAGELIPRPMPLGAALDTPAVVDVLTVSSGAAGAHAAPVAPRGDDWQDIETALTQLCAALRRAVRMHFDEIVLEIIKLPGSGLGPSSAWFALQVKAFKVTPLGEAPPPGPPTASSSSFHRAGSRPVPSRRAAPKVDVPCAYCVGEYHGAKRPPGGTDAAGASGLLGGASANGQVVATRRVPYRWVVFDRLDETVRNRLPKDHPRCACAHAPMCPCVHTPMRPCVHMPKRLSEVGAHSRDAAASDAAAAPPTLPPPPRPPTSPRPRAPMPTPTPTPRRPPLGHSRRPREDSSQLSALAQLVEEHQPGAAYKGTDVRRSTTASSSRAANLRKLYTPASIKAGRPLVCVSAPRLYDEVPVCLTCYQAYSSLAEKWKRRPRALLSVASAPALGLIGASANELPSEVRSRPEPPPPPPPSTRMRPLPPPATPAASAAGAPATRTPSTEAAMSGEAEADAELEVEAMATPDAVEAAASVEVSSEPTGKAGVDGVDGERAEGSTEGAEEGTEPAEEGTERAEEGAEGCGMQEGVEPLTTDRDPNSKRSHALDNLLRHSKGVITNGVDSPLALAQKYAFLHHCLSCNVLCKTCVLEPEEAEAKRLAEEREEDEKERARIKAERDAEFARTGLVAAPTPSAERASVRRHRSEYMERHRKMVMAIEMGNDLREVPDAVEARAREMAAERLASGNAADVPAPPRDGAGATPTTEQKNKKLLRFRTDWRASV